jgi:hypothetical protein
MRPVIKPRALGPIRAADCIAEGTPAFGVRVDAKPHSFELAVEVVGGADQRQVRQSLRKVAQLLARGADFL